MQSKYFGANPLEAVLPALATIESVQTALHDEFGERSAEILNKLKSGLPLLDCELSAYDIITDIVGNESVVEWSTAGLGPEDEFPINVMRFGTVYWIEAQEWTRSATLKQSSKQETSPKYAMNLSLQPWPNRRKTMHEDGGASVRYGRGAAHSPRVPWRNPAPVRREEQGSGALADALRRVGLAEKRK